MPSISGVLRSLGNHQAVANAQVALDARRREEWIVAGVARRLERKAAERADLQHVHGSDARSRAVV